MDFLNEMNGMDAEKILKIKKKRNIEAGYSKTR